MAMGANSSRRSVVGLESREQSIRESSPVRESESRLTASQVSDGINGTHNSIMRLGPSL